VYTSLPRVYPFRPGTSGSVRTNPKTARRTPLTQCNASRFGDQVATTDVSGSAVNTVLFAVRLTIGSRECSARWSRRRTERRPDSPKRNNTAGFRMSPFGFPPSGKSRRHGHGRSRRPAWRRLLCCSLAPPVNTILRSSDPARPGCCELFETAHCARRPHSGAGGDAVRTGIRMAHLRRPAPGLLQPEEAEVHRHQCELSGQVRDISQRETGKIRSYTLTSAPCWSPAGQSFRKAASKSMSEGSRDHRIALAV
jgi:hypothetical protein